MDDTKSIIPMPDSNDDLFRSSEQIPIEDLGLHVERVLSSVGEFLYKGPLVLQFAKRIATSWPYSLNGNNTQLIDNRLKYQKLLEESPELLATLIVGKIFIHYEELLQGEGTPRYSKWDIWEREIERVGDLESIKDLNEIYLSIRDEFGGWANFVSDDYKTNLIEDIHQFLISRKSINEFSGLEIPIYERCIELLIDSEENSITMYELEKNLILERLPQDQILKIVRAKALRKIESRGFGRSSNQPSESSELGEIINELRGLSVFSQSANAFFAFKGPILDTIDRNIPNPYEIIMENGFEEFINLTINITIALIEGNLKIAEDNLYTQEKMSYVDTIEDAFMRLGDVRDKFEETIPVFIEGYRDRVIEAINRFIVESEE